MFNANQIGEKTILVFRSFPLNRDMDTIILFTVAFSYFHYFSVLYTTHTLPHDIPLILHSNSVPY